MRYGVRFIGREQKYMVTLGGTTTKAEAETEKARLNAELQSKRKTTNVVQAAGYEDGPLYCHYCGQKVSERRPTFGFFGEPACRECGGN